MYPEEMNSLYHQELLATPMFILALFAMVKIWKQPKCLAMDENEEIKCSI